MALLELTNITAGYDKNVILKNLNLQVEKGELLSLLGSSGCGKTTTLRLIAGFSSPMEGTFLFNGKRLYAYASAQAQFRFCVSELCPLSPYVDL